MRTRKTTAATADNQAPHDSANFEIQGPDCPSPQPQALQPIGPPELRHVHPACLVPTKDNPRVFHRDAAFEDLVQSIRQLGIVQPLVARPWMEHLDLPPGVSRHQAVDFFDLRAGHRRLAAALEAKLPLVPVVVREMDDKTAMEVTVAENMQRANLTPLEEADGIQKMLAVGWEAQHLADRFGKTLGWVLRRAQLVKLSPAWRKALADPGHTVFPWPATLLERVARLAAASQDKVLDNVNDYELRHNRPIPTVAELDKFIAAQILGTLHGAPWKLDDATLLPQAGACTNCPKRSGAQPDLFDDLDTGKRKTGQDRCLDRTCYDRKHTAHVQARFTTLKADHPNLLPIVCGRMSYNTQQQIAKSLRIKEDDIQRDYGFATAKKGQKGAVPALVVSGSGAGTLTWVRKHSYGATQAASKPARPAAETRDLRRKALVLKRIVEAIGEPSDDVIAALKRSGAMPLAVTFGTSYASAGAYGWANDEWTKTLATACKAKDPEAELIRAVAPSIARVAHATTHDLVKARWKHAEPLCKLAGLDFRGLQTEARVAIPEPAGASAGTKTKRNQRAKRATPKRRPARRGNNQRK